LNTPNSSRLCEDETTASQISHNTLCQGRGDEHFLSDLRSWDLRTCRTSGQRQNKAHGVIGLTVDTDHVCLLPKLNLYHFTKRLLLL
jgi:hypothetical protein